MYGVASFKVGDVFAETPPQSDPFGPQVNEGVHGRSCKLKTMIPANRNNAMRIGAAIRY
jgi:hypothetical protein